ncbi:tRNA lysidine(34) synthetase TilS [Brachyspira aalborgi]|uniref:tRNA(Ile)-lysidine synthase n=1 Tax=Brachyspira aalborgi TaxID=29522 RepID=A0A5C8D5U4_9SPIR|nr:tRNA lysidine(34) synthetase TilS [Brachyspira aalborgi]TXJ20586.1 tRNA lysidine(34) synthetase TilS [Brachyspira aalborgi]
MFSSVKKFLTKNIKDINKKTFAVAYSGGIDSQTALHIIYKLKKELGFNLIIIHINYNLRGEESKKDELFARNIAKKYNLNIYIKEIKEGSYNKKNIQNEARKDRYNFFEELYNKNIFDYLIIAHNKDDFVETIIYRMIKGAGADIYNCLKKKNNYILRPILNFYREEIENYAKENNLEYREDASNKKNKYARNKIRNLIIPMLETINKKSKDNIIKFSKKAYLENKFLRKKINNIYKKNLINKNSINIENIKNLNRIFLNRIIMKFIAESEKNNIEITEKRISEIVKIIKSKKSNVILRLDNFNLIKEYNLLIIEEIEKKENINNYLKIKKDGIYNFLNKNISFKTIENKNINYKEKLYIKCDYPIIVRQRKNADFLISYPNGEKKYLRKIFIDSKIPLRVRDNIPIIENSNNEISAIYLKPYAINRISKKSEIAEKDKYIIEIDFV